MKNFMILCTIAFCMCIAIKTNAQPPFWKSLDGPKNPDGITFPRISRILFDKRGTLYVPSTDDGLRISTNRGVSWGSLSLPKSTIEINDMCHDTATGIMVATANGIFRLNTNTNTWDDLNDQLPSEKFYSVCITNSGIIFAGGNNRDIWRSSDGGVTWALKSNGITKTGTYYTVSRITSSDNGNLIAAADSKSFISTDMGDSWTQIPGVVSYNDITILNGGTMFLSTPERNSIYRSTNDGKTFQLLKTGYPDDFSDYLAHDSKGELFLSTTMSGGNGRLIKSTNQGANWVELDQGYRVQFLLFDTAGYLFASMFGDGIYRTLSQVLGINYNFPRLSIASKVYPNPTSTKTTFSFTIPQEEFTSLKIYNPLGNEVATLVNKRLSAGDQRIELDASHLPSGVYYYRLQIGGHVEMKPSIVTH